MKTRKTVPPNVLDVLWNVARSLERSPGGRFQRELEMIYRALAASTDELATAAKARRAKRPSRERPGSTARIAPGAGKRGDCGARIRELIKAGMDTPVIVSTIRTEFPWSKATAKDVAWNRRKLRLNGGAASLN